MPAFIKPGCDSRHRFACKALFRALLRAGYRVPLPHHVATALDEKQNPIRALIRNGFRRNSSETSLRLVNSALNKGYRFLELLTLARDESSPAHADLLRFLHENNERVLAIREKKRQEADKYKKFAPNPDTVPLLTKIPSPDGKGPPTFVPTVRPLPLEKLSGGVRKLPTLDELGGHPFLRLRKPQSEYLGRVLRQKFQRRQRRAEKYHELVSEELADAEQEDAWDDMVEEMLQGEPQPWEEPGYYTTDGAGRQRWTQSKQSAKRARASYGSYAHAVKLAMADIELNQKREWDEMIARGKALWKLVLEERALAEKEKKRRKKKEKVQRKREGRRAVKAERREARRLRRIAKRREAIRKWWARTQERKKRERAERKRLQIEQEARPLEEAKSEEPAAATTAAVEQESEKVENEDNAPEERRPRGSQALKATRQPKKTKIQTVGNVKNTESPALPVEPAKKPEASPEETPASLQEKESEPEPVEVQPQVEPVAPPPPVPKKRGRPRKVESETQATEPSSTEPETTAPKKRGRPRKVVTPTEEEAPKKRARPRKVVAAPEDEAAPRTPAQTTGASHDGGVARDTFPPTAIHPTGRNQIRKRPSDRMYFSTSSRGEKGTVVDTTGSDNEDLLGEGRDGTLAGVNDGGDEDGGGNVTGMTTTLTTLGADDVDTEVQHTICPKREMELFMVAAFSGDLDWENISIPKEWSEPESPARPIPWKNASEALAEAIAKKRAEKKRGRPKKEITGTPAADSELPKKRGRPKKVTAIVSENPSAEHNSQNQPVAAPITAAATAAPTTTTPTSTASPTTPTTPPAATPKKPSRSKKNQFSPSEAATLFAQTRIQSLLICSLYEYHNRHRKRLLIRAPNPHDPLDPLATSITTPFDKRLIKLPTKLTNKTTASAAQALGLKLDKTDVFWNGNLYKDRNIAHEREMEWLGEMHIPTTQDMLGKMLNDAAYRQRRGRYTMDLWERALCRWIKKDNPFNIRRVLKKPGQGDKEIIWTPEWYLPDSTPESQEIVDKALAQAILDQLVMCSSFKYNMVVKDRRDDRSDKLSSIVRIPKKVRKLLGMMSMAEGTEEEEEVVVEEKEEEVVVEEKEEEVVVEEKVEKVVVEEKEEKVVVEEKEEEVVVEEEEEVVVVDEWEVDEWEEDEWEEEEEEEEVEEEEVEEEEVEEEEVEEEEVEENELVLWGGEVMELEEAARKDFELWKKQLREKKNRWGDGIQRYYFSKAEREKENRPLIRRVLSG